MTSNVARVTMQPLAYRVPDAAKMLGIGRSTVFEMIRSGKLDAKKIGAATVVTHDSILRAYQNAELADATKRAQASIK